MNPELWRVPDMPARDFYSSYFATYLERDVRQLVNVTNLRDFERFVRMCATLSGNLVNFQTLASTVGIAGSTAKQWLTVLEASNIIHILPPYFRNHGKRLIKTPKLFFRDTGLLCFLLGLATPQQMLESTFIGLFGKPMSSVRCCAPVKPRPVRQKSTSGEMPRVWRWTSRSG